MILTPGSPNISQLDYRIDFDISTAIPTIKLTNQSVGDHLDLCTWWFIISTPSGTPVHSGSFGTPDETGNWTVWTMPEDWPQPFNEIEWSGAPYIVTVYVSDGVMPTPNQYNLPKPITICRPNGNTAAANNNYGVASFTKKIHVSQAIVTAQDNTKYLYKTTNGTIVSETWRMVYPPDSTGARPPDMVVTGASAVVFDISYTAEGYFIFLATKVIYDLGDSVFITIFYSTSQRFNIFSGIELCNLICSYQELIKRVQAGQCGQPTQELKDNLIIINANISVCLIALQQGCEIDIAPIINDIRKIGGFDCCNIGGSGIISNPLGTINITTTDHGDIASIVSRVGNNFNIDLTVTGGASDLQAVTDIGHVTTNDMKVQGTNFYSLLSSNLLQFMTDELNSYGGRIVTGAFNGFWSWTLPNKSGTFAMLSDIVAPDLQAVTDVGNITTDDLIVGVLAGINAQISPGKFEAQFNNTEVYGGIGRQGSLDNFGSMWLHRVGFGTVFLQPHATQNTYPVVWPNSQGLSKQSWFNDGVGNMSWGYDNGDFVALIGPIGYNVVKASRTTIICDTNAGDVTINIGDGNIGQLFAIKNDGVLFGKVIINILGGGSIDTGSSSLGLTYSLTTPHESVLFVKTLANNSCRRIAPYMRNCTSGFNNPTYTGASFGMPHTLGVLPNIYSIEASNDATAAALAGGYSIVAGTGSIVVNLHIGVGISTNMIVVAHIAVI